MIPIPIAIIATVLAYFVGRILSDMEHNEYLRKHLTQLNKD